MRESHSCRGTKEKGSSTTEAQGAEELCETQRVFVPLGAEGLGSAVERQRRSTERVRLFASGSP